MRKKRVPYRKVRQNIAENEEQKFYGDLFYVKENIKEEQCSKCIKRGSIKYCRLNIDPEKRVCRNYKGV